ncbi:hypothetical protein INT43_003495 [Umbelopsis isabellina]|uniref:DNA ligase n=1 Tax=Mortierella isabellina TaxID=91625 RepID=A0A8H7PQ58_MORIS|nr:hypothetical protein INT43_003495 [Umbelopsis isabellina]
MSSSKNASPAKKQTTLNFGGSSTAPEQPTLSSFLSGGKDQKKDKKGDKENDQMEVDKPELKEDLETVAAEDKKRKRPNIIVDSSDDDETDDEAEDLSHNMEHSKISSQTIVEKSTPTPTPAPAKKLKREEVKSEDVEVKDEPHNIASEEDEDEEIQQAKEEEEADERQKKEDKAVAKKLASVFTKSTKLEPETSWKKGEAIPYSALCKTFELCEGTTKRTEITTYMVKLFKQVIELTPDGLLELLYLCINKLCPDYEGLELGIGETLLMKAVANSTGRSMDKIKSDYRDTGDLGLVAKNSRGAQRTLFAAKKLTVPFVFKTLRTIAKISGQSSQAQKIANISKLLVACQDSEAKYLIRQLEGKLRIGLAEQTILSALAQAVVLTNKGMHYGGSKLSEAQREQAFTKAVEIVKAVYNQLPCYDMIIPALLKYPIEDLADHCKMTPGIPLKPMLAHPTKALTEILDRFENRRFTCEFKYDGERAQIHRLEDGKTTVYSRNSENMSGRYPDVMEKVAQWVAPETTSFILDCEAVAWDREKKCILPFQVLSTRKRKDVKEEDIKVQVCIFAFDCLFLNGESLLQKPLSERREKLRAAFVETEGQFAFARHMDSNVIDDIQSFLDTSIQGNCEGLMVKTFDGEEASYEPSRRSRNWLKVKKDYLTGIGDSLDLVVIGAFHGRGKRTGVYGAFLLACYDQDKQEFQSICKIGTGFSEEALQTHHDFLQEHVIGRPRRDYLVGPNAEKPDVWFSPVQVWEVLAADLSISPAYMAAVGEIDKAKGISLRFPRFIRIRDDKKPEEATSSEQVADFYRRQSGNTSGGGLEQVGGTGVDDDFEY